MESGLSIARSCFQVVKTTYLVQEPDKSVPSSAYALRHLHPPGVLDNSLGWYKLWITLRKRR
ncbi:hypothetical protein M413DRAFT_168176 [Hebeloma cylindrosporum]|uniref:Uncharacterized protein n=1 Tax=Hebeloma cylindrosporum TaxID=76867 RepID=A0A0C3C9A1_HEBCY|nr:hypothetical protein M413DRAFT_168176 [Hebeloma cylindrosporum h7]